MSRKQVAFENLSERAFELSQEIEASSEEAPSYDLLSDDSLEYMLESMYSEGY